MTEALHRFPFVAGDDVRALPRPDSQEPVSLRFEAGETPGAIRRVDPLIFLRRLAPDCMAFECGIVAEHRTKLDACCSYGVDADPRERDRILALRYRIGPAMDAERRELPWFLDEFTPDPDFPSGGSVRTNATRERCVFLGHAGTRGCVLHVVALREGVEPMDLKPHICSLFPLTYAEGLLCFSEDYEDYSCSHGGEPVYRVQRAALAHVFGSTTVRALDRLEAQVTSAALRDPRAPGGVRSDTPPGSRAAGRE